MTRTDEFPFDDARRLAAHALRHHRGHRDFEDMVSETVIGAWRTIERGNDLPLGILVTLTARYKELEWFSSGKCGDIIARDRGGRVNVYTMPWDQRHDWQIDPAHLSAEVVPDFSGAVIERLVSPAEEEAGEIHYTPWERKQQQKEERRHELAALFVRARERDRELAWHLLLDSDLMEHHREAVRLHYLEGWSMRRVAEHLGTHRVNLHEAIRNARRRLERDQPAREGAEAR